MEDTNNVKFKEDIEAIMRQTECYDVKLIKTKYELNDKNVLETVFDILNIKPNKSSKPQTEIEKMREILDEKDKIFRNLQKK
jgi:hypothetical protein